MLPGLPHIVIVIATVSDKGQDCHSVFFTLSTLNYLVAAFHDLKTESQSSQPKKTVDHSDTTNRQLALCLLHFLQTLAIYKS